MHVEPVERSRLVASATDVVVCFNQIIVICGAPHKNQISCLDINFLESTLVQVSIRSTVDGSKVPLLSSSSEEEVP